MEKLKKLLADAGDAIEEKAARVMSLIDVQVHGYVTHAQQLGQTVDEKNHALNAAIVAEIEGLKKQIAALGKKG